MEYDSSGILDKLSNRGAAFLGILLIISVPEDSRREGLVFPVYDGRRGSVKDNNDVFM